MDNKEIIEKVTDAAETLCSHCPERGSYDCDSCAVTYVVEGVLEEYGEDKENDDKC